jgi:hypothetical protein
MYNKYLVLRFRNAKLFRNREDGSCKDYVFDLTIKGGYRKRMDKKNGVFEKQFSQPITVHQISNLIHVLFNERPVPSHRECFYPKIDYLFEKAKDSFLKYTDCVGNDGLVKTTNKVKGEDQYITEKTKVSKAVWNSWNPSPQINWDIIKLYLGSQENIDWFFGQIIDLLGVNPLSHNVETVRISLLTKNLDNLFNGLTKIERSGLIRYIRDNQGAHIINNDRISLTVNSGIDNVVILNGEILVPINDEDIDKLKLSKGCATILDGGYVWIDSVKSAHEITSDGYEKVGNISTEKY